MQNLSNLGKSMTYKEKIIKELKKIMLRSQTDPTHITYWDGVLPEIIEDS